MIPARDNDGDDPTAPSAEPARADADHKRRGRRGGRRRRKPNTASE